MFYFVFSYFVFILLLYCSCGLFVIISYIYLSILPSFAVTVGSDDKDEKPPQAVTLLVSSVAVDNSPSPDPDEDSMTLGTTVTLW